MSKIIIGLILSFMSFVTSAHPGHGSHEQIIAQAQPHLFLDSSSLFMLIFSGLALYLLVKKLH